MNENEKMKNELNDKNDDNIMEIKMHQRDNVSPLYLVCLMHYVHLTRQVGKQLVSLFPFFPLDNID